MDDKELSNYREESKMEFTVFLYRILVVAVCVFFVLGVVFYFKGKYSLQGTTQGRYLTGGVPPVRFSM